MGITKIKAVKDSLSRIVGYAENPEKTHYSDMQQVLHYAGNQEKVNMEQTMYVAGLHCRREQAYEDMMYTKRHFNKTGGNVAYPCIQSFKTGEVTPELCHQLGVELAQRMWEDRFQVLVATHFNTGTYHNHLVINSLSYKDGKKFNCNQKAFYQMREISDQLCREHNLMVIEHPSGKTPRNLYFAEKQGKPTTFGLMRQAINEAVGISWSWFDFCQVMKEKGYLINASPHRKYATIRAIGAKKAVRMVRLGEEYDHRRIIQRIDTMDYRAKEACGRTYQQVRRQLSQPPRGVRMAGSFHSAKKITGLRALYLHYCYFLGIFPRKSRTKPLSPTMRLEVTKLEQLSRQIELIHREHLNSVQDMEDFLIPQHPFVLRDDEEMACMVESISQMGVISPGLARPREGGGYELVSGHRRLAACERLGFTTMPVIVRELTDEEAVVAMVDANLQREHILPSEKAFAYKMKLEVLNRQGYRSDHTFSPLGKRFNTYEELAKESGDSRNQIHRYIRLTHLVPPLLAMVDEGKMALRPSVELSYLTEEEQIRLLSCMEQFDCTPSHSQAISLKKLSQLGMLTQEDLEQILSKPKANQQEQLHLPMTELKKFFPATYSDAQMKQDILKGLELLKRQRERNRRER